jgi:hypothetical protein
VFSIAFDAQPVYFNCRELGRTWAYSVAMKNGIVTALLLSICLLAAPSIAQENDSIGPGSLDIHRDAKANAKQAIEYKIAGLRPGRDSIDKAYGRFHKDRIFKDLSTPSSAVWTDACNREMLTVAFDSRGTIREVRTERQYLGEGDCELSAYTRSARARLGGTGHELVLRDSCKRIQQIYGLPQSQHLLARDRKEFVYRFDRIVKGNTLTLELICDSTRDQVETMKLTASSPSKP